MAEVKFIVKCRLWRSLNLSQSWATLPFCHGRGLCYDEEYVKDMHDSYLQRMEAPLQIESDVWYREVDVCDARDRRYCFIRCGRLLTKSFPSPAILQKKIHLSDILELVSRGLS